MLAMVPILGLVSCAPSPPEGCPDGAESVVFWSSETDHASRLQFVGDGRVLETRTLDVQGLSGSAPVVRSDSRAYLMASGNATGDRTTIVEFDSATCAARMIPLALRPGYAFTVDVGEPIVAVAFVDRTEVARYGSDGTEKARVTIQGRAIESMAVHEDRIIAFAGDDRGLTPDLLVLDRETLAPRDPIPLAGVGLAPTSIVLRGEQVFFPLSLASEKEDRLDHRLARTDLETGATEMVDLGSDLPYLVADAGNQIVVGHTFINPAYQPTVSYRHVSRVTGNGILVGGSETDLTIRRMEIRDGELVVLGLDEGESAALATYDVASMRRLGMVSLGDSGQFGGHHYAAAVVALD